MTEHKITCRVEGEGRIDGVGSWEILGVGPEDIECSCGETFAGLESAWDHYEETH